MINSIFRCILVSVLLSSCTTLMTLTPTVTNVPCSNPGSGAITQVVTVPTAGAVNINHHWSTGAITSDISGLIPNYPDNYRDNITFSPVGGSGTLSYPANYDVLYKSDWIELNQMGLDNATAILTTTGTGGNAASRNVLPENAYGYFEFNIGTVSQTNAMAWIGLNSMSNYVSGDMSQLTGIKFLQGRIGNSIYYFHFYEVLLNGVIVTNGLYNPGDKFQIKYNFNGVYYYQNGTLIYPNHYVLNIFSPHPEMYIACKMQGISYYFQNVNSTFGCSDAGDEYAELTKKLDASYYIMTNKIKFRYKEKYNNNVLKYVVYDWQRNQVISYPQVGSAIAIATTGTNTEGINYHSIKADNNLKSDAIYTIEVTDDKNEMYQMRFRYFYEQVSTGTFPATSPANPVIGHNGLPNPNDYQHIGGPDYH